MPTADRDVDIMGVNFECVSDASRALRGNDRGPTAGEGVKNDPTVRGDVTHGIGDQSDRLDSGVHGECFVTARAEAVHARIAPDVGPVAPPLAQPKIVDVRGGARFESED